MALHHGRSCVCASRHQCLARPAAWQWTCCSRHLNARLGTGNGGWDNAALVSLWLPRALGQAPRVTALVARAWIAAASAPPCCPSHECNALSAVHWRTSGCVVCGQHRIARASDGVLAVFRHGRHRSGALLRGAGSRGILGHPPTAAVGHACHCCFPVLGGDRHHSGRWRAGALVGAVAALGGAASHRRSAHRCVLAAAPALARTHTCCWQAAWCRCRHA